MIAETIVVFWNKKHKNLKLGLWGFKVFKTPKPRFFLKTPTALLSLEVVINVMSTTASHSLLNVSETVKAATQAN